jgi:hypothetical protein
MKIKILAHHYGWSRRRTGEGKGNEYYLADSLFLEESSRLDGLNAYGPSTSFLLAGSGVAANFLEAPPWQSVSGQCEWQR